MSHVSNKITHFYQNKYKRGNTNLKCFILGETGFNHNKTDGFFFAIFDVVMIPAVVLYGVFLHTACSEFASRVFKINKGTFIIILSKELAFYYSIYSVLFRCYAPVAFFIRLVSLLVVHSLLIYTLRF